MYILILLISYPLKKGKIFYQFLFPKKKKKKKKKKKIINTKKKKKKKKKN